MINRTNKLNIIKFVKDFLLASRLVQIFTPFNKFFAFVYRFNALTKWVHQHKNDKLLVNDFYRPIRNYSDREKSFEALINTYKLNENPLVYLEFGVANGLSFKWWLQHINNSSSRFYGFDTFEGLPEKWGHFAKGDMIASIPEVDDRRASFYKGIFQDTLNSFLFREAAAFKGKRKVIHMDADLFSATLFALSQLYPYLEKGDIIMFDEFNVYDHEFLAYKYFTECFYVNLTLISAQNNFYHAVFMVA
jgi:O-methyltransferase